MIEHIKPVKWASGRTHPRRQPSKSGRPVPGTFMEISRKCPKKAQKASTLPRHLCPVGANGAMTKRHETVGAIAKRPLDAPRYYSGHGEGPTSSIRPPSHAWRARQDGKSGRRGASGTKRPLGRSAAPTESPLHAPRACPTLRDSLSPHAGIGGNAWGTAPRSKRRPNVGRLQYYETQQRRCAVSGSWPRA